MAFRADFHRFQYCFVDFFVDHLTDVSRQFKGDMQMAVLLGVVGQLTLQAAAVATVTGKPLEELPADRRGITTFRLADATGIPRETVRRKLVAMERLGWVTRQDRFWMVAMAGPEAEALGDLGDLTDRSIGRAARFLAAVLPMATASAGTAD